ncbi:MAG TPA: chemotaxis protein CheW, partial [Burkholderiaceae bacterium]|nr:chemotaxis protein CheW [Burkholderiaceae bacterium]
AGHVREARTASKLAPVSMGSGAACVGLLELEEGGKDAAGYVWVYDLGFFVSGQSTVVDARSQIVVVSDGTRTVGLLVSELHGVAKFVDEDLIALPLTRQDGRTLVSQVIKAYQGEVLIQLIDTASLFGMLGHGERRC